MWIDNIDAIHWIIAILWLAYLVKACSQYSDRR